MKKLIIVSIFLASCLPAFAQSVWKGGAPGRATDWMEPRNWSDQRVPGWEDDVLIPHLWHNSYPVINTEAPAIAHLEVEGGARLDIGPKGYLPIDGGSTTNSGILLIGIIRNEGAVSIFNTAQAAIDGQPGKLINQNQGRLAITEADIAAHIPKEH